MLRRPASDTVDIIPAPAAGCAPGARLGAGSSGLGRDPAP